MSFGTAIATCLRKYASFRGRARRSEYWWFVLFYLICLAVTFAVAMAVWENNHEASVLIFFLMFFILTIPRISALVRRLHDMDCSGWWYWITLIPFGGIVLLVWSCMEGTDGENRFGADPRAHTADAFD